MSDYLNDLIYDRTFQDVENRDPVRGYVDSSTLNRVETAIKYVAILLNQKGYRCNVKSKINWSDDDKRLESEMQRIRNNLVILRDTFFAKDDTPMVPERITYTSVYQANAIEKIIYDIGDLIENTIPGHNHLAFKLGARAIGNRG